MAQNATKQVLIVVAFIAVVLGIVGSIAGVPLKFGDAIGGFIVIGVIVWLLARTGSQR